MNKLESIRAKAAQDAALASALKAAKTQEELLAALREAGFDVTADELAAMKQAAGGTAIPDEELDNVAGGKPFFVFLDSAPGRRTT